LLGVTAWRGFSARAQASSRSELYKLHVGEVALDPRVSIAEELELGIAPAFNEDGYLRERVALIDAGRSAGTLTNARSAREYGLTPNGALAEEAPTSLAMQAGGLADHDVLARIGTGLYVGNLWYVNFSDRMNCRLTGMTRFATFWVEDGQIVAPLDAMRFDDSLYRLLGSELEELGAQAELLLSDGTWGERATGGMQLPGILARSFQLTL
jgi:predicted Zn-dependent protease